MKSMIFTSRESFYLEMADGDPFARCSPWPSSLAGQPHQKENQSADRGIVARLCVTNRALKGLWKLSGGC